MLKYSSHKEEDTYGKPGDTIGIAHPCSAWWSKNDGAIGKQRLEDKVDELLKH